MEKRAYKKPSMKVYEIGQSAHLLVGSEYFGYTPGIAGDDGERHLA
jgi:hypothetical protein